MPPTLNTMPAEIIYELAEYLALPELNALHQTRRLFYQQLNHSLHKRGLAMITMTHPTHRHEEGKPLYMCQEKHYYNLSTSLPLWHRHEEGKPYLCREVHYRNISTSLHATGLACPAAARLGDALESNEPWLHPSVSIVAWLGAGLDPNACTTRTRRTLLHRAVEMNDEETVTHLLAYGANVNAHCRYGRTPLHLAVSRLNGVNTASAVASALLRGGADQNCVDVMGETPLHYAVRLFHCGIRYREEVEENVKILVKGGAVIDQPDHKGLTPRGLAP
jgi:hypothetical protein